MKSIIRVAVSSTLAVAIGISMTSVAAQDDSEQTHEEVGANNATSVELGTKKIEAGRSAYIDPDTGELRSTPAVQEKPESTSGAVSTDKVDIIQPDLVAPQEIEHPDGTVEIILNGQMDSALQVTLDCAGNTKTKHSDNVARVTKADECQQ